VSSTQTKIWQRVGTQGDEWKNGLVQFSPSADYTVNKTPVYSWFSRDVIAAMLVSHEQKISH
jgi:hypothetical protein